MRRSRSCRGRQGRRCTHFHGCRVCTHITAFIELHAFMDGIPSTARKPCRRSTACFVFHECTAITVPGAKKDPRGAFPTGGLRQALTGRKRLLPGRLFILILAPGIPIRFSSGIAGPIRSAGRRILSAHADSELFFRMPGMFPAYEKSRPPKSAGMDSLPSRETSNSRIWQTENSEDPKPPTHGDTATTSNSTTGSRHASGSCSMRRDEHRTSRASSSSVCWVRSCGYIKATRRPHDTSRGSATCIGSSPVWATTTTRSCGRSTATSPSSGYPGNSGP